MSKEIREQSVWEKRLSQLLGEYMEEKKKNPEWFLEISTVLMCAGDSKAMDSYMVSKQFWFIEWLVDNHKININKEWDDYEETNLYCNPDFYQLQKHYSYYESLLMLLAIQDNPTEFLISVLK